MNHPAQPAPEGALKQSPVPTNYPWLETAHFRPTNSDTLLLAWVRNDSVTYRTGRYLNEKFSGSQETEFRTQPNYFREVTGLFMMPDEGDKLRARCERLEGALRDMQRDIPASDGSGGFYTVHFDGNGEEIGIEPVDPVAVVGHLAQRINDALAQQEGAP